MRANSSALSYGMFFGKNEVHREVPGFSVSVLEPTLRAEEVPLHSHDHASFVLVLQGSYISSADGAGAESAPSTLIFNPVGTTHRDSFKVARGRFLAVSLSDESLRIATKGILLPSSATAFTTGHAVNTAFNLAGQCLLEGSDWLGIMEGLCWELLSNMVGERLWADTGLPPWLRLAKELLQDQCDRPLLIAELAKQLGTHPVYLARTFRRAFRCTPGEYLMRCRLQKVMTLLRDTKLPLSQIALSAGFFDQSHLTHQFRKHFGVAPSAYRKDLDRPRRKVSSIQEGDVLQLRN